MISKATIIPRWYCKKIKPLFCKEITIKFDIEHELYYVLMIYIYIFLFIKKKHSNKKRSSSSLKLLKFEKIENQIKGDKDLNRIKEDTVFYV